MDISIDLAERRLVPDRLIRNGIKKIIRGRLESQARLHEQFDEARAAWVEAMRASPVALETDAANRQHYEVPAAFFEAVLGPHLKYSSGYWPTSVRSLADSEETMLELTLDRAELADGQRILELGCGWGSLTLFMAQRLPNARIVAVSNSNSQREHIERKAKAGGLSNVEVLTRDMNTFDASSGTFDRIVSVEMFEHMRNWEALLARCRRWLKDDGRLFIHVFAHRIYAYPFETTEKDDWMGRNFFTGGMMPSVDLLDRLQIPFSVDHHWTIDGTHYQRTADAWADKLRRRRADLVQMIAKDLGRREARRVVQRWHLFFRACSELFGFEGGQQWMVCHYLLSPSALSEVTS